MGAVQVTAHPGAAFTVSSKEAVRYNDALITHVETMDADFMAFIGSVAPYWEAEEVDIAAATAAQSTLVAQIGSIDQQVKAMEVPDSDQCRNLHRASLAYIDNTATLAASYGEVIAYMAEHNPGSEQDQEAVDAMVADGVALDDTLMAQLQAAQQAVAKKHGLKLK